MSDSPRGGAAVRNVSNGGATFCPPRSEAVPFRAQTVARFAKICIAPPGQEALDEILAAVAVEPAAEELDRQIAC